VASDPASATVAVANVTRRGQALGRVRSSTVPEMTQSQACDAADPVAAEAVRSSTVFMAPR
jgi:hypothetical protein